MKRLFATLLFSISATPAFADGLTIGAGLMSVKSGYTVTQSVPVDKSIRQIPCATQKQDCATIYAPHTTTYSSEVRRDVGFMTAGYVYRGLGAHVIAGDRAAGVMVTFAFK
jgi:hypothetical protein